MPHRQLSIEEIDALIAQDPKFWSAWDGPQSMLEDAIDELSTPVPPTEAAPHPVSATVEAVSGTSSELLRTLEITYEFLAANPRESAENIVHGIITRTSASNPFAAVEQVKQLQRMIFDLCSIPSWAHRALIEMIQPNPEFALRFIDSFVRSFVEAYNAARPSGTLDATLRIRFSTWIRFVLIPFIRDHTINCGKIPGNEEYLQIKPDILPHVFLAQIEYLRAHPEAVTEMVALSANPL